MARFLRYGWLTALLMIVVLTLTGLALVFIPGLSGFFGDIVVNGIGEIFPMIKMAVEVIKGTIDQNFVSPGDFGRALISMITTGILDAAVMGVCTFLFTTIFNKIEKFVEKNNHRRSKTYSYFDLVMTGPKWLPTVLGILVGVVILRTSSSLFNEWQHAVKGLLAIGIMAYGIYLMMSAGKTNWKKDYEYTRLRDNTLLGLLLDILTGMLDAVIVVMLTGCVLRSPYLITSFKGFLIWVAWIAGCVALMYIIEFFTKLIKPNA